MKSIKKLDKYIVSYDRFGAGVGVNYKGSRTYKTRLGALCSLTTVVFVVINLVNFFTAFLDGSNQTEFYQTLKYETFGSEAFNLSDMNFKVRVLITPPVPQRIGSVSVR